MNLEDVSMMPTFIINLTPTPTSLQKLIDRIFREWMNDQLCDLDRTSEG